MRTIGTKARSVAPVGSARTVTPVPATTLERCSPSTVMPSATRTGLLPAATADTFMDLLAGLGVALDTTPDRAAVVGLARTHRLSVYDAAYLELAQRRAMALASLDRALVTAAKAEGVACLVEA